MVVVRGVQGSQCSPKHNAFDSSGCLCLGVTQPRPFLRQGQAMETSARAHKQTTAQATIQEVLYKPMFRATFVTCSRTHQGMDKDGLENGVSPQKSHQRSQSTGCVLVRKAPTTPHSQATAPQAKDRWGLQGRRRWGFKRHPRQGVNVKSTWSGCEVKLGTCHCLPYHVHLVHTRVPMVLSSPTTERYPLWW